MKYVSTRKRVAWHKRSELENQRFEVGALAFRYFFLSFRDLNFSMGSKHRNKVRKSRKNQGFHGTPHWRKKKASRDDSGETSCSNEIEPEREQESDSSSDSEPEQEFITGASRRKMSLRGYGDKKSNETEEDYSSDDSDFEGHGYRLIDLTSLSNSISEIHKCGRGEYSLTLYSLSVSYAWFPCTINLVKANFIFICSFICLMYVNILLYFLLLCMNI